MMQKNEAVQGLKPYLIIIFIFKKWSVSTEIMVQSQFQLPLPCGLHSVLSGF